MISVSVVHWLGELLCHVQWSRVRPSGLNLNAFINSTRWIGLFRIFVRTSRWYKLVTETGLVNSLQLYVVSSTIGYYSNSWAFFLLSLL